MRSSVVLTVIGPDRPGIVGLLAATIAAHGGNWEQSRMAHLAGQFAGILRVAVPADRLAELRTALDGLGERGLRVLSEHAVGAEPAPARALRLEVTGGDREGIVREIAGALAARGVNVEELDTSCQSAPMSGAALFHARALLRVPQQLELADLRGALEALADDLMVDIALLPVPQPDADK